MRLVRIVATSLGWGRAGLVLVASLFCGVLREEAREFTVMAYNVEMLFDVDGVSLFEDYKPPAWGPQQLDHKLAGISSVLRQVANGKGPDVICFEEFEADQTPESTVTDMDAFLRDWSTQKATDLLRAPRLDPRLAGLPVQAWLAKRLADDGLTGYHVAVGGWRNDPSGHLVFHTNVIFSRFPIVASRTHETIGARGILEVQLDVDGNKLFVFDNHWKSGASDPVTEDTRIGNAEVLRRRLDEILRKDPQADVILAGDFNSQYNQKQRYPEMPRTAMNDVLGSQGDEVAFARPDGPPLYNLWFELPPKKRGSDEYHHEWGTLMEILVTRGLYDFRGVQYVDNSFTVAAFPGLNANRETGQPVRWTFAGGGEGFSDHFPVIATFRTTTDNDTSRWIQLTDPSHTPTGPAAAVPVKLPLESAVDLSTWPAGKEFRSAENVGQFFKVRGQVSSVRPFRVRVDGPKIDIAVWIYDRATREAYFAQHGLGKRVSFVGELGQYRDEWQLVIPKKPAKPRSTERAPSGGE